MFADGQIIFGDASSFQQVRSFSKIQQVVHFISQMNFTSIQRAAAGRKTAFAELFGKERTSDDEDLEYDFKEPAEGGPSFSIRATVDREGEDWVKGIDSLHMG
jgi:hypothetical protein